MNLKDLAIKHPYYCSDSNYYCNDATYYYDNMKDFLDEMENVNVDMNLCFRWDVRLKDDESGYYAEIFIMQQRKGKFTAHVVDIILEEDIPRFLNCLNKHLSTLRSIWKPLSL